MAYATLPDLLRLLAVPVLGWAAYRDVQTRRVPNRTWYPLVVLGVALLAFDALTTFGVLGAPAIPYERTLFVVHVAVSLGLVVPLSYLLWRVGGFGGADAKALMALAVLFPEYPAYYLTTPSVALPVVEATLGVFSFTVLTNTVLLGLFVPLALALRNAVAGRFGAAAFVARPVPAESVTGVHGKLLESPDGFTRSGLDLDALRMYLRWRRTTLASLRADPSLRDPATLPDDPGDPTDGAVNAGPRTDGGRAGSAADAGDAEGAAGDAAENGDAEDPWGAAAFLASVDGAYGTTPEDLRDGLDVLVERETVWVSPGLPFIVVLFAGLVVALTAGDLLVAALGALGVA